MCKMRCQSNFGNVYKMFVCQTQAVCTWLIAGGALHATLYVFPRKTILFALD